MSWRATVLAAYGDFVYVERSEGLDVIDVSNPREPSLAGRLESSCCTNAMLVEGEFAYGIDGSRTITVLDVSNPASPSVVGSALNAADISAMAASMGHLYVASDSGLTVYDIANPNEPRRVGGIEAPDLLDARSVALRGDFAYVVGREQSLAPYAELLVIEISTPESPTLRSSLELVEPIALTVNETHAYVVSLSADLYAVDVTMPDAPHIVDMIDVTTNIVDGIALEAARVYVYSETQITRVVDVEDPADLQIVGLLEARGPLAIGERYTFAMHESWCRGGLWNDLLVVDTTRPWPPGRVGHHPTTGRHITLDGHHAYIANGTMLEVLDLSNSQLPERVGGLELPAVVVSLDVHDNHLYCAGQESGVLVYDVSEPGSPQLAAQIDTRHSATLVAVRDDVAYVADYQYSTTHHDTIHALLFDVTEPTQPGLLGAVSFREYPRAIAVEGSRLTVVGFGSHVIDVTDPSAPLYLGVQPIYDGAGGVDVSRTHVYVVATTHGCLDVVDLADEFLWATSEMGGLQGCTDIVLSEPLAYVMCWRGGLKVIDLSDTGAPQFERVIPLAATPRALAVEDNLIVVTGDSGTEVFLANCPTPTAVTLSDLTATATESSVLLRWRADPNSFTAFSVLRAVRGRGFEDVSRETPIPGRGPWRYVDSDVEPAESYSYQLVGHLVHGGALVLGPLVVSTSASTRRLGAVQPNPTTGAVTVHFSLTRRELVRVRVFDVAGRLVREILNGDYRAGTHAVLWNGDDAQGRPAANGIYLIRFETARSSETRRVVLVR